MRRRTIRLVVILGTLATLGITSTQVFWLIKAFDLRENEFNHNVNLALRYVAGEILKFNNHQSPPPPAINQLSSNYFVVLINDVIDPNLLEVLLKNEFSKRNISTDFEYSIYDCTSEKMVYGDYVSLSNKQGVKRATLLPKWNNDNYYFGVYFPHKQSNLIGQMGIWLFSTFVLLLVIVFFGYTLFIILKQKRLSEIQKDFINNMTHEFRTPIATITISSEVLKNPSIINQPERLLSYASVIQDEANRLKSQVERVLQMASLDREKINLKKEQVDIHEVIKKAVHNLQAAVEEKKARVSLSFEAESSLVDGDRLHLTNIIHNLIDNSVKYSETNLFIEISTKNEKSGIVLSVKDNGIGISKENQKKIFDKFYRVPTGNIHNVKGFGLGLNYVNLLVKAHNGSISLQSEEKAGCTFTIFLPFKTD